MAFRDLYTIDGDTIVERRGIYRDKPFTVIKYFSDNSDQIQSVYSLMETVYNTGEHDGRKHVRNAVKEALDIEL